MNEIIKLRLFRAGGTAKAYLFSLMNKERTERGDAKAVWLPRSQLEHVSAFPAATVGEWQECEVTLPLWLAEKKGLV